MTECEPGHRVTSGDRRAPTRFVLDSSSEPPVVWIQGDVDLASADDMSRCLSAAIADRNGLVIDLSETTFMASSALNILVRAHQLAAQSAASIVIRSPSSPVARVLALAGLDRLFTIESSVPASDQVAYEVEMLYRQVLERWNKRDAGGYANLFAISGTIVDFDGTEIEGAVAIKEHLRSIFADHVPAAYVAKVREIREFSGFALLRAVAGMVPPGANDLDPKLSAAQVLIAIRDGDGWQVAHFQSTPAAFHGRPDEANRLTAELRTLVLPR